MKPGLIADNRNPRSLASRMRVRRFYDVADLITEIHDRRPLQPVKIIDVGGTSWYWDQVSEYVPEHIELDITLCNLDGRHGPDADRFRCRSYDAAYLNGYYPPLFFDLAISNSLLEHVGGPLMQRLTANSIREIARAYYVQTPAFEFPIEPHWLLPWFHRLPQRHRARLVQQFRLGWMPRHRDLEDAYKAVRSVDLLNREDMERIFPDAEVSAERVLGLPKSWIAVRRP